MTGEGDDEAPGPVDLRPLYSQLTREPYGKSVHEIAWMTDRQIVALWLAKEVSPEIAGNAEMSFASAALRLGFTHEQVEGALGNGNK